MFASHKFLLNRCNLNELLHSTSSYFSKYNCKKVKVYTVWTSNEDPTDCVYAGTVCVVCVIIFWQVSPYIPVTVCVLDRQVYLRWVIFRKKCPTSLTHMHAAFRRVSEWVRSFLSRPWKATTLLELKRVCDLGVTTWKNLFWMWNQQRKGLVSVQRRLQALEKYGSNIFGLTAINTIIITYGQKLHRMTHWR